MCYKVASYKSGVTTTTNYLVDQTIASLEFLGSKRKACSR